MTREAAAATVLVDNAKVRVTRFDMVPGAETGWHVHGHDYVITAVTSCDMRIEEPDGAARDVHVPAGAAYQRDRGVEHNVINGGAAAMTFIEVELK